MCLITNERIKFVDEEAELYLMEAASYGGNSGAPVFFYFGLERKPGSLTIGEPTFKLAGIMSGSFQDLQQVKVVETSKIPVAQSNMGIAAVVPAYKLHDVLFGEELKKQRGQ